MLQLELCCFLPRLSDARSSVYTHQLTSNTSVLWWAQIGEISWWACPLPPSTNTRAVCVSVWVYTQRFWLAEMCTAISGVWRKLHQPRVYLTVEPILFLYSFASFLSYTVFQELLHHLVCQQTPNCSSSSPHQQRAGNLSSLSAPRGTDQGGSCGVTDYTEQLVQTTTSHWLLYTNIASGVPAILVSVFYGAVSEVKGRRVFMVLPALGSLLNQAVVLLVIYFPHTFPLPSLLVGALLGGLSGSFPVFNFAVYSYVSDVSAESKRTVQISVLESMTFLGATLSLLVGGWWVNNTHFSSPLYCVVALDLLVVLYVILALPESLEMTQRPRERGGAAPSSLQGSYSSVDSSQLYPGQLYPRQPGPSSCMCTLLRMSWEKLASFLRLLFGSWKLTLLLGMFFIVEINFLGITDTVILFALGSPLCWGTALIGYFLAAKVFMNGLATLFLLPLLSLLGVGDSLLVAGGLVAGGAALVLMGLATHTWMMFLGVSWSTTSHHLSLSIYLSIYISYTIGLFMFLCSSSGRCYERVCGAHHSFNAL